MDNQFSAARERKALEAAMADFIKCGGKIIKVAPVYRPNQKSNPSPIADDPARLMRTAGPSHKRRPNW